MTCAMRMWRKRFSIADSWQFAVGRRRRSMQDFRKLIVWQRAQDTCVSIYKLTAAFPAEERYGICSQLRRAAVSVGANLAEGSKRQSNADKARIFNIAQGEAAEAMSILD